ncbi:MAG: hypothetical protein AAF331_02270, partial [Pseudomonadota bacterium]
CDLEAEVMDIHCSQWEIEFKVQLRVDQFSMSVCKPDGSQISGKNRRTILKALVGEYLLKEYGDDLVDLPFTEKRYRLYKKDPNDAEPARFGTQDKGGTRSRY